MACDIVSVDPCMKLRGLKLSQTFRSPIISISAWQVRPRAFRSTIRLRWISQGRRTIGRHFIDGTRTTFNLAWLSHGLRDLRADSCQGYLARIMNPFFEAVSAS